MSDFWLEDEDDSYKLKPIKQKGIVLAEKKLGIKLPNLYKKLIKEQNGGYIQRTVYPIDFHTSSVENSLDIYSIYGIGEGGILDSPYLIEEWGLPNELVLLDGDGHTWVAMDYRGKTGGPSIVYIDVEEEVEFQLAHSFQEFIAGLQEEDIVDEEEMRDDMDIPNLDEITMEEAEHIFKTSDDEILIRSVIINIRLAKNDMNWMLGQLTFLLGKINSEGIAEEAADFLVMHSHLRKKMDDSKYSFLVKKLKQLPYSDVKNRLEMIGKVEFI